MKSTNIILGVIVGVIVVVAVVVAGFDFLFPDLYTCEDEIVQTEMSDDGIFATYLIRNCGATTTYSYQIKLSNSKNEGDAVFISTYNEGIEIEWKDNKTLIIKDASDDASTQIYTQESKWKDIDILYEIPEKYDASVNSEEPIKDSYSKIQSWLTYTNEELGFSIDYPEEWLFSSNHIDRFDIWRIQFDNGEKYLHGVGTPGFGGAWVYFDYKPSVREGESLREHAKDGFFVVDISKEIDNIKGFQSLILTYWMDDPNDAKHKAIFEQMYSSLRDID